jgi:hypothetical protein
MDSRRFLDLYQVFAKPGGTILGKSLGLEATDVTINESQVMSIDRPLEDLEAAGSWEKMALRYQTAMQRSAPYGRAQHHGELPSVSVEPTAASRPTLVRAPVCRCVRGTHVDIVRARRRRHAAVKSQLMLDASVSGDPLTGALGTEVLV